MAYGTAEQGGDGTDVSLADFVDLPSGSPTHGQRAQTPFVSAPAIGKLQKVMGSVTITRANVIVAQPAVGDLVYEGDLIETGVDGLIAIVFADGTTFRLYDCAHLVLDEFVFGAERSSNSALFRVLKGRFSFLSGLVAATGRLIIDSAVARIQNARPAAGIGGLAFSVFTIGLIHELNAASADIALLDDGTITCKDLKHGVFEIITKGDHPQRFIVDDPCVSIHFQIVGSQVRVSEVANTPGQMALFHEAFLSTYDAYSRGQQDAFIRQWQNANAQPNSTFAQGSPTLQQFNLPHVLVEGALGEGAVQLTPASNTAGEPVTTTVVSGVFALPPPPTNVVIWNVDSGGTFETNPDWNVGKVPGAQDTAEILTPVTVTIDLPEAAANLVIGAGATLDIVPGGSLTVANSINNAGLIELNDPTLSINGTVTLSGGGVIEMLSSTSYNLIIGVPGTSAKLENVDNTIFGSGIIGRGDGQLTFVNDAAGTVNANVSGAGNGIVINTGNPVSNAGLFEATLGGTFTIDDSLMNSGVLKANGGTVDVVGAITGSGSAMVSGGGTLELGGTDAQTLLFNGLGMLKLDGSSDFTGTVTGPTPGDIIDLADTIVTTIALQGSTLIVNGVATSFHISGLPTGDTLALTSDGGTGTDLTVTANGPPVIAETTPTQTIGANQTDPITGVSLNESGNTVGDIFTVTLLDSHGVLSATDTGGVGNTVSSPGTTLIISGTLSEVNADLATLKDTDSAATPPGTPETITLNASDSFDNIATPQTIDVTVNGVPVIAETTPAQTIGVNQTDPITGVSLSESGNTSGEIFTVTLLDSHGVLSATDTGGVGNTVSSPGTTLIISGTLSEVNADLATLKDTDSAATPPGTPETITLNASDSFDNIATPQTIDVTVNGVPVIAETTPAQTIGVNQTDPITGVSLSESGNTSGEIFTVTLLDSHGVLSATDTGGVGNTVSSPGTTLIISGTLSEVNADLATLKDTDSAATPPGTPETITLNASDSFDNIATPQTIDVTVNGVPVIAETTPAQTIGVNQTDPITGVSLSESGNTSGETFTVTLLDSHGVLSATDTGGVGNTVSSPGTTLTISGTLSEVNADLATLKDTDSAATPPGTPETITLNASDSFDNIATPQTIDVTVNGVPVIAETTPAQTIGVNQTDPIIGVSLSESGNTSGEIFTVTLLDSHGVLSATDTGGVGNTVSSPGTTLTISGTLTEVNADLATLTDTDGTAGTDNITVTATDGFGNSTAAATTFDVTVAGLPVIAPPTAPQTIGVNQPTLIPGVSLNESNNTATETFTVTLADTHGVLSATDTGGAGNTVSSPGTTLTISGSLTQVNADLATLHDTDGSTTGSDTITLNATDSFGNSANQTIALTVNGPPVIAVPTAPTVVTVGVGQPAAITGVSVSESGNTTTSDETFTVTLIDANGDLSATGTGVSGGGTSLTISGSLTQVNADLATLHDTDGSTTGSDTITLNATDSFGNSANQTIALTVNGPPVIAVPGAQTLDVDEATAITGVSVSESGNTTTSDETFTVTLIDANGDLSATGTGVSGGGTSLTISGSLTQVNADLATLHDTDGSTTGSDTITLNATDSFGNSANQTIALTVNGPPVIAVPGAQTLDVDEATAITGVSVSESGNTTTSDETFTVTLIDANGDLSATGTGVSGGGTSLTISGSLSQVNSDLATLTDTTYWAGSDTITVTANDSFGNGATPATIAVTVAALTSFSAGTINYSNNDSIAYSGPQISSNGSTLTLTNDQIGEYGSWFSNNTYSIDSFTASFDYQAIGAADGMAFILQDDPRGSSAVGTNFAVNGGSGLGYDGISPSAAVEFNIYNGHVRGTNFATDGSAGDYNSTGNVAFWNGDEIQVLLTYNGSVLTETLTDLVNDATYSASYTVNLAQILGSDIAYVGFSAGTGAEASTQTISNFTFEDGTFSSPAGVAGSPINLALTNPSAANGEPITVTVTGVPSDWQLNEGTNLGNGAWTIQTDDLSALTVMTTAAYAGAMVLSVTESWANADGSTGIATIADNVEAYAPGAPIFALSGNDTLTGTGGNDEFVFAQPIGNDTVYNFNAATDKIDLIGFANVTSFSDLQISQDSSGDAVVTLATGETITLNGVSTTSLTANDFVFNQTPVVENDGTMVVSDGAMLPLGGTVDNSGTIALGSIGDITDLQIIGDGVTLQGGGQVILSDSSENMIVGANADATLTNVDNTIAGAGQIGTGDGSLTLVNEAAGTIDANIAGGTLTLDTGNTIVNAGLLEATNGGTLDVQDGTIDNTGIGADGIALGGTSTLLVDTATLDLTGGGDVSLANGSQIIENADSPLLTVNGGSLPALDLDNVDNIISGAGTIGSGDGLLALTNSGTIDANVSGETLTINTGNAMTNTGTLEASNGGTLLIDDAVNNSGAGNALIEGGIVDFASTTNVNEITFNSGSGAPAYGELVLGEPTNGQNVTVSGFTGTAPNLTDSDSIDLAGSWTTSSPLTGSGGNLVVELKDGSETITLTFDDFTGTLNIGTDGSGGTLITDPPAPKFSSPPVSVGGPGNDNFHFHPGLGADTGSSNSPADTTEYGGQFTSPQEQHWSSQIKEDSIECVHAGHANTPPELDATHWHALHNAFYLH
jgi:hypothetical protein